MTTKRRFLRCITLIAAAGLAVGVAQAAPAEGMKESDLIAVLQSNAAKSEKAITCKRLAVYGSDKCVGAVAPLLGDEELSSWARIALEAIPGAAADAALREALGKVDGRLLVGVINSVAVRRDGKAVDALIEKLGDGDADVASAAAAALGHIGGDKAARMLAQSLDKAPAGVRSAAAEGCILCAEGFLASDRTADAVRLYDKVRQADVADERHLEAIRGAILARGSAGLPLLIEQLESDDVKRCGIGLRTARELGGREVTEALSAELLKLRADRRALLLLAMADRKDSAVLPTVLKAARGGSKDLRITAINILIDLGDVSCVPVLLDAATEGDGELEEAAVETLVRLGGQEVDSAVASMLGQAKGKQRRVLIEVAGQRQIGAAVAVVASSLKDIDAGIRSAAVRTIGIMGEEGQAGDLAGMLQKTGDAGERAAIKKSLLAICGRCGAKCMSYVRPLAESKDAEVKITGLQAMAIIGGPEALGAVRSAIEGSDSAVQDEAVRILSSWPNDWPEDSEAGAVLLRVATSAEKMSHKVLGVRGYLQYVRGDKKLSSEQKVAEVEKVLRQTERSEEKRQAVAVLGEAPCVSSLELLTTLSGDESVAEEAYAAMASVAGSDSSGISRDRRREVLETVAEKTKNNGTRQRARRALSGVQ